MLSNGKRLIQVKVNDSVYDYLKRYSEGFGVSISSYCEQSIITRILYEGGNAYETQTQSQST